MALTPELIQAIKDSQLKREAIAGIGEAFANRPSVGGLLLGQSAPKYDLDSVREYGRKQAEDIAKANEAEDAEIKRKTAIDYINPTSDVSKVKQDQLREYYGYMASKSPEMATRLQPLIDSVGNMSASHVDKALESPLLKAVQADLTLKQTQDFTSSQADKKFKQDQTLEAIKTNNKLKSEKTETAFKQLPKENQIQIEDLARSKTKKATIKSSIDAAIGQLDSDDIDEDQKITIGNGLIKTLNSKEGADAVGAEEAKRLAGFLEYKIANFTQPGSFIGRDLDKFIQQAKLNSASLGDSISEMDKQMAALYGREQVADVKPKKTYASRAEWLADPANRSHPKYKAAFMAEHNESSVKK